MALRYDATVGSLCVWRDKTFLETVCDSGIGLGLTGGLRWCVAMGSEGDAVRLLPKEGDSQPGAAAATPAKDTYAFSSTSDEDDTSSDTDSNKG